MITKIEALRYRSLRHVARRVGKFHTLVGPNGSGKSSFLDVIGFLGDLVRVGPRNAILGDGIRVPARAADPLHLCWMRVGTGFELAIEFQVPEERRKSTGNGACSHARYEVSIEVAGPAGEVRLATENFWLLPGDAPASPRRGERTLFPELVDPPEHIVQQPNKHAPKGWRSVVKKNPDSGNDYFQAETSNWSSPFRLGPERSALANIPEDEARFPAATWARRFLLEGVQRVNLSAEALRRPSPPGSPSRFLPDGSNLPWVVQALKDADAERFQRWIAHVKTAIPDLRGVSVIERPEDRHRYLVVEYENGLIAPSWLVSDGTLRLFALTLLAYLPSVSGIYLVEEPENGIHPRAVEAVYQSLSSVYGAQVLCASHSPVVLGLARADELLCFAKDANGAVDIVAGTEHPRLSDWKGEIARFAVRRGSARLIGDLVVLTPDLDIEQGLRGLLSRPQALGIRAPREPVWIRHGQRNPGVFRGAHLMLAPYAKSHEHAHVARALGWVSMGELRGWLEQHGQWPPSSSKPSDPKKRLPRRAA